MSRKIDLDEDALRRLYPGAPEAEILATFPGVPWKTISNRARVLGVRRRRGAEIPPAVDALIRAGYASGVSDTHIGIGIGEITGRPWPRERVGERARSVLGLSRPEGYAAKARRAALMANRPEVINATLPAIEQDAVARFMAADFRPYELNLKPAQPFRMQAPPRQSGSGCAASLMLDGGSSRGGRVGVRRAA